MYEQRETIDEVHSTYTGYDTHQHCLAKLLVYPTCQQRNQGAWSIVAIQDINNRIPDGRTWRSSGPVKCHSCQSRNWLLVTFYIWEASSSSRAPACDGMVVWCGETPCDWRPRLLIASWTAATVCFSSIPPPPGTASVNCSPHITLPLRRCHNSVLQGTEV